MLIQIHVGGELMKTLTTPTPLTLAQQSECILFQTAIEVSLSQFIRWTLQVTASGECSGDIAIALLDQAWTAQKLLWSLRDEQNSCYSLLSGARKIYALPTWLQRD